MGRVRSLAILCAGLIGAAQAASAQRQSTTSNPEESGAPEQCRDLGSFAIVDPPGAGRGTISAQPYTPCADLDGGRPRDSVQIGVDVLIGNRPPDATGTSPSGRMLTGQAPRRRP